LDPRTAVCVFNSVAVVAFGAIVAVSRRYSDVMGPWRRVGIMAALTALAGSIMVDVAMIGSGFYRFPVETVIASASVGTGWVLGSRRRTRGPGSGSPGPSSGGGR